MEFVFCDDDCEFLSYLLIKTEEICLENYIMYNTKIFTSAEEMFDSDALKDDVVLLLDIDMPGMSGFEAAEKIQNENEKVLVIFVSNKDELVFDSFLYHPFFFIRKNYIENELEAQILRANEIINPKHTLLDLPSHILSVPVYVQEIIYVECVRNYLNLHMYNTQNIITVRMSLLEAEEKWSRYGFVRIHVGYLINMAYVSTFNSSEVTLKNNIVLPISRTRAVEFKRRLMEAVI